ncbi:MAG: outer membrane protein assembly factor BamC [Methylophilaceae bacterium]
MKKNVLHKIAGLSLLTFLLSACGFSIPFMDNSSDYKKGGGSARPLEVPPDLTSATSSDAYNVPGGATSYSEYSQQQEGQEPGVEQVLKSPDGVRMEKAGSQRWLVVDAPAEKVWPVVREFWLDQGFAVRVENAETGVMETEWVRADNIKVEEDTRGYGERFDKWLDNLSGLADRRKFRTRLERGEEKGTTEVFMTHRTVAGAPDDGKQKVQTQLGEIDLGYRVDSKDRTVKVDQFEEDLDAELLRRLMVKLGVAEDQAKQIARNPVKEVRAEVVKEADQSVTLKLKDNYARGWRRVGLALDRVGFVVEDKDRSKGMFYVRYADVDIDKGPKEKKGLFDTLAFWRDDEEEIENKSKPKEEDTVLDKLKFWKGKDETTDPSKKYNIYVSEIESGTKVNIVDSEGNTNPSTTANRIISLLYNQLK